MGEIYNENLASSVLTFKTEESTAALGGMHVPHASCRPMVYALLSSDHGAAPGVAHTEELLIDPFAVGLAISDPPVIPSKDQLAEYEEQPADNDPVTGGDATATDPLKSPLYKRKWFRITSVIGVLLGIALLFIILFPVLKAVIQDVINKTQLTITTAAITNPSNTS